MTWSIDTITGNAFAPRFNVEYRNVVACVSRHLDLAHADILDFGCGAGIAALRFALGTKNTDTHVFTVP